MSNSLYNKLAFRGYLIKVGTLSPIKTWVFPYRTVLEIKDMMRFQPCPDYFPSPEEACAIITNLERNRGYVCKPHSVEDLEGNILWFNDK